ncbi:MAG TPA: hypothetical protein VN238_12885 [Solirubrobacteraceae bacterium]|nr:hypothetical protein [Solirubrobacteraceae bacterium]
MAMKTFSNGQQKFSVHEMRGHAESSPKSRAAKDKMRARAVANGYVVLGYRKK